MTGYRRTQPYHNHRESTIVYGAYPYMCCCISGQRLASGDPVSCSKEQYKAIAQKAASIGLGRRRAFWEAHIFGIPCFGHSLDLNRISEQLCESFPTFIIQVVDAYEGCEHCGHWEFVVRIRPRDASPAIVRAMVMMKG